MQSHQFDRLASAVGIAASRRCALAAFGAVTAAIAAAGLPIDPGSATASKGRKKKTKRNSRKKTCRPCLKRTVRKRGKHRRKKVRCLVNDAACPDNCAVCFALTDGGTACSSNFSNTCTECASEADCPAEAPRCVTSLTNLGNGSTFQVCSGEIGQGFCFLLGPCS